MDLNYDDAQALQLRSHFSRLQQLYLPETVLKADLLVSMPKLKTHHWAGVTLSMKNLFGIIPSAIYGWPKNVLHWAGIAESILDINSTLPVPQFAIVDGIVGMEGNGPIQGTPKPCGMLILGDDLVAVDATAARLMTIDPGKIPIWQRPAASWGISPRKISSPSAKTLPLSGRTFASSTAFSISRRSMASTAYRCSPCLDATPSSLRYYCEGYPDQSTLSVGCSYPARHSADISLWTIGGRKRLGAAVRGKSPLHRHVARLSAAWTGSAGWVLRGDGLETAGFGRLTEEDCMRYTIFCGLNPTGL